MLQRMAINYHIVFEVLALTETAVAARVKVVDRIEKLYILNY